MALNESARVAQLARARRLDAAVEVALGEPPGGAHELVERPPHRGHEQRDQRDRPDQRGEPGDDGDDHGLARVVVRLVAGLLAPFLLPFGEVAAQSSRAVSSALPSGFGLVLRGVARLRGLPRALLSGDPAPDDLGALLVRGASRAAVRASSSNASRASSRARPRAPPAAGAPPPRARRPSAAAPPRPGGRTNRRACPRNPAAHRRCPRPRRPTQRQAPGSRRAAPPTRRVRWTASAWRLR